MRREEILYGLNFLRCGCEASVKLGLRDPLVKIGRTSLVLLLHQSVQLVLIMKLQPSRHRNYVCGIGWPEIFGVRDKSGSVVRNRSIACALSERHIRHKAKSYRQKYSDANPIFLTRHTRLSSIV